MAIDETLSAPAAPDLESLVGNAEAFPILRTWDFYNHAGVAPIPHVAAEAMREFARQAEETAYLGQHWYRDIESLRTSAARLINADRREIAFIKNTSEGIATVANGIDWRPGDRIVTTAVEYPANIYPWMDVSKRFGVELVMVPEETSPDGARRVPLQNILAAADDSHTRLLALSHVEYASGQRHDLERIGTFCRENGMYFCVDAIQSLGILPVDVAAMKIDFRSADGHKWLLGPEGAGIFYCRADLIETTRPLIVGWMNVINDQDYGNYDFTLKTTAGKFECGSFNVGGLLGLKASLELLAGLGTSAVAGRIKIITDRLIAGLRSKGYQVLSPREAGEESGIVSFASPRGGHEGIDRTLRAEHHIELAVREGRLRCSPHFYNTEKQIDRLIELLPGD